MRTLLAALLLSACSGCDFPIQRPHEPSVPTDEPTIDPVPTDAGPETPPSLTDCEAACSRWEKQDCKQGFAVCEQFDEAGDCIQYVSCEIACRRDPHAYPAAACVAGLPQGISCSKMEEHCGR